MGNTVLKGGAPAIEVAGSLSDGIFIQNLSTNPVYLASYPGVSASACDGVIQPGGNYSVGKNRNVYLYADVNSAVVWSFDSGATASQGSVVSGSVAVPAGVGINGNVNVKNINQWDTLLNTGFFTFTGSTVIGPSWSGSVAQYNTLGVGYRCAIGAFTPSDTNIYVRVQWFADAGLTVLLDTDGATFWAFATGQWQFPIRGAYVNVQFYIDKTIFGSNDFGPCIMTVAASLDNVGEKYINNPSGAAAYAKFNGGTGINAALAGYDMYDGNDYLAQWNVTGVDDMTTHLPSIAGPARIRCAVDNNPSGGVIKVFIGTRLRGQPNNYRNALWQWAGGGTGSNYVNDAFIAPRRPLGIEIVTSGTPSGAQVTIGLAFQGK